MRRRNSRAGLRGVVVRDGFLGVRRMRYEQVDKADASGHQKKLEQATGRPQTGHHRPQN